VTNNEYRSPTANPKFNYAGAFELLFDAHQMAMKPKGSRFISTLLAFSLYGNYHYWSLLAPFDPVRFGLTCASTFILSML